MNISVTVHTRSKYTFIKKDEKGVYHVYIHESPVQGRANEAVTQILADFFEVKKYNVTLIKGERSKQKIFFIAKTASRKSS